MKSISLTILITLMIIVSITSINKYLHLNPYKDSRNESKTQLIEAVKILNECFDLENKNKRSLNQSIKLIEFCLEKYGYKK